VYAGFKESSPILYSDTDSAESEGRVNSFFDLRDRETFVQVTNLEPEELILHIQIWNVDDNCNENDFFDIYTINDTHVYNMRDIQTNDGNPSGVELPDDAYGIVIATVVRGRGEQLLSRDIIGNFRIIDDSGYEYRTNSQGRSTTRATDFDLPPYTFNFNKEGGVTLSDIVGITVRQNDGVTGFDASNFTANQYKLFDVDIVNNNEVIFSCRNVIFACIDEDNPRQEELLEFVGNASVARFEYGINEAIPHSKGGELLCPGNVISEGTVLLNNILQNRADGRGLEFFGYVGLNNGDGRGSMDSFWLFNREGFNFD